jgi:hypothetical protein
MQQFRFPQRCLYKICLLRCYAVVVGVTVPDVSKEYSVFAFKVKQCWKENKARCGLAHELKC